MKGSSYKFQGIQTSFVLPPSDVTLRRLYFSLVTHARKRLQPISMCTSIAIHLLTFVWIFHIGVWGCRVSSTTICYKPQSCQHLSSRTLKLGCWMYKFLIGLTLVLYVVYLVVSNHQLIDVSHSKKLFAKGHV